VTDYAQLAQSLKDNEAFQRALDIVKSGAIEALCTIDHDDAKGVLKLQATIGVVNDIRDNLDAFIRQGKPKDKPGIA
jgi:hypothetical protein